MKKPKKIEEELAYDDSLTVLQNYRNEYC